MTPTPTEAAAAVLNFKNWTGYTLAQLIDAGRIARTDKNAIAEFTRAALGNAATLEALKFQRTVTETITTPTP
jgi:hypothetical protein